MRISDWSSDVCSSDLVEALARSKVARIAMVSCNPNSFARDARTLIDGGYRLTKLWPVGQFRWSIHVELVAARSEEHTSELQSLMRISYAVFCLNKKKKKRATSTIHNREYTVTEHV